MDVHFSSKTYEWATPQAIFDRLDAEYHFWLDVCATKENAKCRHYFTIQDNGLAQTWAGNVWMNPPYGREIGRWVAKAAETARRDLGTVVCLLPARTDTRWWHEWVIPYGEVEFIKGRLKFGGSKNSAPFPSAIVVFSSENTHSR